MNVIAATCDNFHLSNAHRVAFHVVCFVVVVVCNSFEAQERDREKAREKKISRMNVDAPFKTLFFYIFY